MEKNVVFSFFRLFQMSSRKSLLSFISLLFLFLLTSHGFSIFRFDPAKIAPKNTVGAGFELSIRAEKNPPPKLITHLGKSRNNAVFLTRKSGIRKPVSKLITHLGKSSNNAVFPPKRSGRRKPVSKSAFSERAKGFFGADNCKSRFFMTWISSVETFGEREFFTLESLFKFNPNGCLVIVSSSMDSDRGMRILRPLSSKSYKVIAISPDFNYLLKHTPAEFWFSRLKTGKVNPGEISLGQNLSNLLRLALLYKFGGVYLDTDFVILKSFSKLKNSIGAQTLDLETKNWSRLNNAVMIFDKGHPILYKFIEEFALTFDGNKWGHNGPYLVSRVISRENRKNGIEVNIMKPMAFYPVDWSRIGGFFRGPRNATHSQWLSQKYNQIRNNSFAVHLWNKQSRKRKIEKGSVISRLISDSCVFCDS